MRSRMIAFAAITALCVLGGAVYVAIAAGGSDAGTSDARVSTLRTDPAPPATVGRRVLVRGSDEDDTQLDGQVTVARLGGGKPRRTPLACQRVHMAGGRGVCLTLASSGIDYSTVIFDEEFREVHSLALDGLPSRTRVSPDGRLGAVTSFVTGHAYAESGEFSTRTRLLDLRRGAWIADLEDFEVRHHGQRIEAPDFNFWGVTFERDGRGFYATLSTGSHRYLVHGDVAARRVEVLRDRVECPSLSPDGTRVAYKRTLGNGRWRLHVLNLRTGDDRALSEERSIDDQVEWLDDRFVLYGDGEAVFVASAKGGDRPRRVLAQAASPTALR
jgi:hypothetical protein